MREWHSELIHVSDCVSHSAVPWLLLCGWGYGSDTQAPTQPPPVVCVCVCVYASPECVSVCVCLVLKMCVTLGSPLGHGEEEEYSCGDLWLSQHCQAGPIFPEVFATGAKITLLFLYTSASFLAASQHHPHPASPSPSAAPYYFLPVTHFLLYIQGCSGG